MLQFYLHGQVPPETLLRCAPPSKLSTEQLRPQRKRRKKTLLEKSADARIPNLIGFVLLAVIFIIIVGGLLAVALVIALNDPCKCNVIVAYNGTTSNSTTGVVKLPTEPVVIAVFADQGLSSQAKSVMQLVRDNNASMVFHVGNFDYVQGPKCWVKQIFQVLANDSNSNQLILNYFGVYGNQEFKRGHRPVHGYSVRLRDELHPQPADCCCTGRVGTRATCIWKNIVLLQIGMGVTSCYTNDMAEWVRTELDRLSDYAWKFCLFHESQPDMQLAAGGGTTKVSWALYEACKEGGAIILNGHDHRYARTYLMSDFGPSQSIASTSNPVQVGNNKTFAVISGLGGDGIREADPNYLSNPWWAASLNKGDPLADFGAFFIQIGSVNVSGNYSQASAFFRTINGYTFDPFTIEV
jgi:hypothetical protein